MGFWCIERRLLLLPQDKLPAKVVGMLLIKFAVSNGLESLVMSRSPILSGQLNLDEENNNGETHPAPWCVGWEICRDMDGYAPWMVHHGPHGRIETSWPILVFQCVPESSQLTWYFRYDYDDGMSWNLPSCPEVSDFKTSFHTRWHSTLQQRIFASRFGVLDLVSFLGQCQGSDPFRCRPLWRNLGCRRPSWVKGVVAALCDVVLSVGGISNCWRALQTSSNP